MNYIITKNKAYFKHVAHLYEFTDLDALKSIPNTIAFDSETTG